MRNMVNCDEFCSRKDVYEMNIKEAKESFLGKHDCADERIDSFNEKLDEGKNPTSGIIFSNDTILNSDVLKSLFHRQAKYSST